MAKCINIRHPEYKSLARRYRGGQRELKARIATWQELNNTEMFPSLEEVDNLSPRAELLLQGNEAYYANRELNETEFIQSKFQDSGNVSEIKKALDNVYVAEQEGGLTSLAQAYINVSMGSELNTESNADSFYTLWKSLFSAREKNNMVNAMSSQGGSIETLSNLYTEYLYTGSIDHPSASTLLPYFNRINSFGNAINTNLQGVQTYLSAKSFDIFRESDLRRAQDASIRRNFGVRGTNIYTSLEERNQAERDLRLRLNNQDLIHTFEENDRYILRVNSPVNANYSQSRIFATSGNVSTNVSTEQREQREKFQNQVFQGEMFIQGTQLIQGMLDNFDLGEFRPIAERILTAFRQEDVDVQMTLNELLNPQNMPGLESPASGMFYQDSQGKGTIVLSQRGLNPYTVLHEGIHALSYRAIYAGEANPTTEYNNLKEAYEYAKNALQGETWYGMNSIHEFVSEVFSKPSFRQRLKQLPPMPNSNMSFIKRFFNSILELLGIRPRQSFFEQAYAVSSKILTQVPLTTNVLQASEVFADSSQPASRAARMARLRDAYTLNEIKDLSQSLTDSFIDLVTEFEQYGTVDNPDIFKGKTRFEIINQITPSVLFEEMRQMLMDEMDEYLSRIETTDNTQLQAQFQGYASNIGKLLDNFDDMLLYASVEIGFMEELNFDYSNFQVTRKDVKEELDNGVSQDTDMNEGFISEHEYAVLDSWQTNFKHSSVGSSMTTKVKKALRNIDEIIDGKPVYNTIGRVRKLNMENVKNHLLQSTSKMITSRDLLPLLHNLQKEKPWVEGIISQLQQDDELFSQFYQVFRRDFVKFSVTNTSRNPDGSLNYRTIFINQSDSINLYMERWRGSLENNEILTPEYSIYTSQGTLNITNVNNNLTTLNSLTQNITRLKREGTLEEKRSFIEENTPLIKNIIGSVGVSVSDADLSELLADFYGSQSVGGFTFNITRLDSLLESVSKTTSWASRNPDVTPLQLIQDNRGNYTTIAKIFAGQLDTLIEASVHQNGKSYYTYLQPSYLTKLTKNLKGQQVSESFDDYMQREFRQYSGTLYDPITNTYNISWLNKLNERSPRYRNMFDHKVLLTFNNKEYSSLNPTEYANALLVEYFSNNDHAWYHVPILAEAPSAEFIKFEKFTSPDFRDQIANELLGVFKYEYSRIKIVRERRNLDVDYIKNLDSKGDKFHFLTFLNDHLEEIDSRLTSGGVNGAEFTNWIKSLIIENLDLKANTAIDYLREQGLMEREGNDYVFLKQLGINPNNVQEMLTQYFYNSYLATTNIIQLTNSDLAYYNNIEDFQKRNKQIHAPGLLLNTQATYNGQRVGKDTETTVYLRDDIQRSTQSILAKLNQIFVTNNTRLSNLEKANIITKYGASNARIKGTYVNVTESSPLLNLPVGYYHRQGRVYTPSTQEAFDNAQGNPQLYYMVNNNGIVVSVPTASNNITDAQAYRTLSSYKDIVAMSTGWNDTLEASYQRLNRGEWDYSDYNTIFQAIKPFMYSQIPVNSGVGDMLIKMPTQHKNSESLLLPMLGMQFNSPKLRGLMEAMSVNGIDVIQFESAVKVGLQGVVDLNGLNTRQQVVQEIGRHRANPNVYHKLSYEDYKIQQPIPEHLQDTQQLFGTQLRKLATSDLSDTATFEVNGETLSKQELLKLYNDTIIENTLQSYERVKKEFSDPKLLQQTIENELFANQRYSRDLINACQLNEQGEFVLPLYEPSQSMRVQQLLNSIWRSRVTKQKIKGGSAVQMSAFGLSDTLEIAFKPDGAIDYIEAYLPWWSESLPLNWDEMGFIDTQTGIMDAQAMVDAGVIDSAILDAIAYRIPTEDKYSMLPIRVKGFLPRNAGGNIMLPMEITTITGSDFDVDKMYLMFKEFTLEDNKFKHVDYNLSEDVSKMNKSQRDNLLIDIVRSVLTNADTVDRQLNPGNFDGPKKTARILNILASGANYTYDNLNSMNLDELDLIQSRSSIDILDFTTQLYLHKQNMTASKLIGIVANHSVNHAVRQNTQVSVSEKTISYTNEAGERVTRNIPRFMLNGKFNQSLHDITVTNEDGSSTYISKNYASFLAASVDAVKDPVLAYLNLNTFTADSAMLLTGLGYSFNEVGLLLRQPSIERVVEYYDKFVLNGINKTNAVNAIILEYQNVLSNVLGQPYRPSYSNQFTVNDLADQLKLTQKVRTMRTLEGAELNRFILNNRGEFIGYYQYQLDVLYNYRDILDTAQKLADMVAAMRADTQGGGAGPTIAHTLFKRKRVEKHIENALPQTGTPVLTNSNFISLNLLNNSTSQTRINLRNSPIGFMQGFTTLGIQGVETAMSQYFPQTRSYFQYVFDNIEGRIKSSRLSADLMNTITTEFFAYYMSQYDYFTNTNENGVFIREFPSRYKKFIDTHPELSSLSFIKNIRYLSANSTVPVPTLRFISGGRLSSNVRDEIISEWESMLYGDNETRQIAMDLFKYNYFLNGFGFGQSSFIHLAPAALKTQIPEYMNGLKTLMGLELAQEGSTSPMDIQGETLDIFIDQFFRNHLSNRRLTPEVFTSDEYFTNENGILDSVEINIGANELNEFMTQNGGIVAYVYKKIGEDSVYYQVVDATADPDGNMTVRLNKATPLGIRNNLLEYHYNNPALDSVISQQDYNNIADRSEFEYSGFNVSLSPDAFNYDYVPEPANLGVIPEFTEADLEMFSQAAKYYDLLESGELADMRELMMNTNVSDILADPSNYIGTLDEILNNVGQEQIDELKNRCNG